MALHDSEKNVEWLNVIENFTDQTSVDSRFCLTNNLGNISELTNDIDFIKNKIESKKEGG